MCIGRYTKNDRFEFDNLLLENSKEEVVLGITIDNKLTFDNHIKNICRKAEQKLGALLRITNYLNSSQKKPIFSGMIKSQFNYCPLIHFSPVSHFYTLSITFSFLTFSGV